MSKAIVKVAVVIGSYNRLPFLKLTIQTLRAEIKQSPEYIKWEIIIVDGGSTDGSINWLTKQKDVITIIQHNRGTWRGNKIDRKSWGYFMNLGFRATAAQYIIMLSDDCLVIPGALIKGIEDVNHPTEKIGGVAFWWRNWPEETQYFVGKTFGEHLYINHGVYNIEALKEVDFLNENDYFFYHADSDVCLEMIRKGYQIIPARNSFIEHYSDANSKVRFSNYERKKQDWDFYLEKWGAVFGQVKKNDHGRIYRTFSDPENTAKLFFKIHWQNKSANKIYHLKTKLGQILRKWV